MSFEPLPSGDQREQFIGNSSGSAATRSPPTDENEYREEYYRRVAYANDNFSSGIPGWKMTMA